MHCSKDVDNHKRIWHKVLCASLAILGWPALVQAFPGCGGPGGGGAGGSGGGAAAMMAARGGMGGFGGGAMGGRGGFGGAGRMASGMAGGCQTSGGGSGSETATGSDMYSLAMQIEQQRRAQRMQAFGGGAMQGQRRAMAGNNRVQMTRTSARKVAGPGAQNADAPADLAKPMSRQELLAERRKQYEELRAQRRAEAQARKNSRSAAS